MTKKKCILPFYCSCYIVFAVGIDAIEALVVKHFSPSSTVMLWHRQQCVMG